MAHILNDRIVCDKSDPVLKIRLPPELLKWIIEDADFRGTSVQDMLCELLFDRFYRVLDTRGHLQVLNPLERKLRAEMRYRRQDDEYRYKRESAASRAMPEELRTYKKPSKGPGIDWAEYTALRATNIQVLELEEYAVHRRVKSKVRTRAEVEEVSKRMAARGIVANSISIRGKSIDLRSRGTGAGRLPPSEVTVRKPTPDKRFTNKQYSAEETTRVTEAYDAVMEELRAEGFDLRDRCKGL